MPTHCPECGTELAPREGGRRRHPLPQRAVLPGAAAGADLPRRRPRRVRHRGARLRGGDRPAAGRACVHGRGRPLRPRRGEAAARVAVLHHARTASLSANGRQAARPTCRAARTGRCGGCSSRCRSGTSARRPRGRWPATSRSIDRDPRPRPRRSSPPSTASARPSPRRSGSGSTSTGTAAIVDEVARGRRPDGGRAGRRRRRGTLEGLTVVVTGSPRRVQPRRGEGGDPGARRQGRRARCRRRPTSSSSGTNPGSKYDKAVQLGVPILDEAGFRRLLELGPSGVAPSDEVPADAG